LYARERIMAARDDLAVGKRRSREPTPTYRQPSNSALSMLDFAPNGLDTGRRTRPRIFSVLVSPPSPSNDWQRT
jgi:hypothetical protein